ncbi:component of IIS longevity pathway SMK-1-domain-containing protein [Ganoderma leucocontextum]|nr:component of IIS longevity pathway SMK-1-domain-containing protein [Ganoderma leucocontextum]
MVKERVCEYIQNEEYIKALIDVFHQAEDLESLADLHALFACMQTILLLNEHSLYEHILDDDVFMGVVGILEYDPEFPNYKANYRDFLCETSRFHQPIPIRDDTIQRKIHHTYRLLFLKDVVLARAIDDSTFDVLNSSIIFNQIAIVQNDQAFLREIAGMFMDDDLLALLGLTKDGEASKELAPGAPKDADKMDVDSTDAKPSSGAAQPNGHEEGSGSSTLSNKALSQEEFNRRREVVFLLQQLCMMGKNVQLPARMALFRALVDRGMIATSGEIMMALLDHDLNGVRGHVLKQLGTMEREKQNGKSVKDKETVLMLMCRVLVRSRDLAVQSLLGEALRLLLELVGTDGAEGPNIGLKMLQQRAKDDPGIEKFLDYFYKFCIELLFKPFQEVPETKDVSDPTFSLSREKTNPFMWLCDLLSNFTQQHSFRSYFFVLSSNIAPRVATLLRSKDKHLRLAAFRFFRTCLRLKNGNIFKHLIKHEVFQSILTLTTHESKRDNLENIKELIHHCMTKHGDTIRALAESPVVGPRFKDFISRWEINIEPPPIERMEKPLGTPSRGWGQGKLLDTAEEDYFNGDDEDEDDIPIVSTPPHGMLTGKRKRSMRPTGIPVRALPKPAPLNGIPRTPPLGSLVDYGDADGDADDIASIENIAPIPGRASPIPGGFISVGLPPSPGAGPGTEPPASPRITHRQVSSIKSAINPEDDGDILEELSKGSPTLLPRISGMSDVGAGSKRRRGDDDDDELLERLSKAKRQMPNPQLQADADSPGGVGPKSTPPKGGGEEGPKKLKLRFGAVGAAVASGRVVAAAEERERFNYVDTHPLTHRRWFQAQSGSGAGGASVSEDDPRKAGQATTPEAVYACSGDWSTSIKFRTRSVEAEVLEEIARCLVEAGIELQMYKPCGSCAGPVSGLYEVITAPLGPLEAADAVVFTRETIYNITNKHSPKATFSPRLHNDNRGNGAHTHISLHGGNNAP